MTPRYGLSAKSSVLVLGGDFGGGCLADAGAEAEVGVVRLVSPGGVGMRGWVDAGRGRGCMVVGVIGMLAMQLKAYASEDAQIHAPE